MNDVVPLYGIFRTSDGGSSWDEVISYITSGSLYDVPLILPTEQGRVWVSNFDSPSSSGFILFSDDKGMSWDSLDMTGSFVNCLLGISPAGKMMGLSNLNAPSGFNLVSSTDNGQTWVENGENFNFQFGQRIHFFSEQVLVYLGGYYSYDPNISLDGGETWQTVRIGKDPYYNGLCMASQVGDEYWVGDLNNLATNRGGGLNWKNRYHQIEFAFSEMAFGSGKTGFATSYSDIFYTVNGGKSFHILQEIPQATGLWGSEPGIRISYPADDVAYFCSEKFLFKWER